MTKFYTPPLIPAAPAITDPDKASVAAVVGGQLVSVPARGIGLTPAELTFVQGGSGGSGGGISDGDKGDIVVSNSGATWTFDAGVVTAAGRAILDDVSATAQRTTLGLGYVDNTSDTAKPVSTAQQTALNLKADLASPALSGTPTAPTPATATNTTQIATTAFVKAQGYGTGTVTTVTGTAPVVSSGGNAPAISMPAATASVSGHLTTTDWNAFNAKLGDAPNDGLTYGRKNLAWTTITGGGASVTTSDTAPASPSNGALWYETDTGNTFIFYIDPGGAPGQWVQINAGTGGTAATLDRLVSTPADMSALFATSPNRFVINDKPDGTGTNVASISDVGDISAASLTTSGAISAFSLTASGTVTASTYFVSSSTSAVLATTGAGNVLLRPNGFGSATGQFYVTSAGDTYTAGTATVGSQVTAGQNFVSSSGNVILATTGAGGVFLRPNGVASGTGQLALDNGGNVTGVSTVAASGTISASTLSAVYHESGHFNEVGRNPSVYVNGNLRCKNGISVAGGGYGANVFNTLWNTAAMVLFVDNSNLGTINTTSDYRIKKDVVELPSTWDRVKALRPISYTQAEFTPPMSPETEAALPDEPAARPAPGPLFTEDSFERWGFIAHETQETLVMAAASGHKDMVDGVQGLQWAPILAATVKALQEAMARIEALEAARAV